MLMQKPSSFVKRGVLWSLQTLRLRDSGGVLHAGTPFIIHTPSVDISTAMYMCKFMHKHEYPHVYVHLEDHSCLARERALKLK